ncbi:hypothetical protein [Niabella soli]|uniref:Uncharacterized protein n=1 Tax=Niabella soli DSM 19437 TaxID=929713 RepID=W0F6E5_9BACT|nr:hypothetical protein [Niabella soli]AHF17378.1 hypothetical protein NIASO_06425 [Niabella soli DSM 19437]
MKKYLRSIILLLAGIGIISFAQAQTAPDTAKKPVTQHNETPADSLKNEQDLEKSLTKAAAAAEKAAGKIRGIVETKADKLAKTSEPYIESLAASAASLFEKLANELDKMTDDKQATKKTK